MKNNLYISFNYITTSRFSLLEFISPNPTNACISPYILYIPSALSILNFTPFRNNSNFFGDNVILSFSLNISSILIILSCMYFVFPLFSSNSCRVITCPMLNVPNLYSFKFLHCSALLLKLLQCLHKVT